MKILFMKFSSQLIIRLNCYGIKNLLLRKFTFTENQPFYEIFILRKFGAIWYKPGHLFLTRQMFKTSGGKPEKAGSCLEAEHLGKARSPDVGLLTGLIEYSCIQGYY